MNTKIRNICEVVLQGVLALLLFLPGMYTRLVYSVSVEAVRIADQAPYSCMGRMDLNPNWLGWLTLACVVLGLVVCIVQVAGHGKTENLLLAAVAAPLELVAFLLFSLLYGEGYIAARNGYSYLYAYVNGWLFFVTAALLITLTLIAVIGHIKAAKKTAECTADACKAEENAPIQ